MLPFWEPVVLDCEKMSEILKQVNEAGIVEVVRVSALDVSALSHDAESLSLKKATVMFRLLERISECRYLLRARLTHY